MELARGNGRPLLHWLRQSVHAHGSLLSTVDLLRQATGQSFDASALLGHLRRRYVDRAS
jgi:carboxypeptidase Taq